MALSTSITTDGGLTAPNAYLRVADLCIGKRSDGSYGMFFVIAFYADAQAATDGKEAIREPYPFINKDLDIGTDQVNPLNPIKQAYAYAKAVWTSATDV